MKPRPIQLFRVGENVTDVIWPRSAASDGSLPISRKCAPPVSFVAGSNGLNPTNIGRSGSSIAGRRDISFPIQSFFDADLKLMNRAHNAEQAMQSLALATQYFDNITLDLIYGMPNMTNDQWLQNIETALSYGIPHISCYALTVEPKTALHSYIQKGQMPPLDEALAAEHFKLLVELLEANGFVHYEFSNFGKPNYFSQNNSSYWLGKKYLGIGPSAHSFDGQSRSWNVSNNAKYIKAIQSQELHSETEILSLTDRYNEYIMTGLRTIWGVSLVKVEKEYGVNYINYLNKQIQSHVQNGLLKIEDGILTTTAQGKFLGDGIVADLFVVTN
jgi:oxygen-independent coproporphyrinogen-3 oxidase